MSDRPDTIVSYDRNTITPEIEMSFLRTRLTEAERQASELRKRAEKAEARVKELEQELAETKDRLEDLGECWAGEDA